MSATDRDKQLAAALGRIPSGLFIITARQGDSETGMLASWVQQCSFTPPRLSLAIKPGREVAVWLSDGAVFTVNVLDDTQTDMIVHFGRGFAPDEPAFTGLEIQRHEGRPPVLSEALAYLECQVTARHPAGDHDLFIATVLAGQLLGDGQPMTHVRKSGFHY